jgi:light-regulated signal transduction histidine kinase (bacteriophytochrome)
MASLLEKHNSSQLDENGQKFLYYINHSAERMSSLIQSLLDYGRLGKNAGRTLVDCNEIIGDVTEDLYVLLNEAGATMKIGTLPQIHAYKSEVRLLFQNLIENAVKFRKKDVRLIIQVAARQAGDKGWLFSVSDNGIGIDATNHEKIFTIFRRLHTNDEYPGTGIGLAHCMKIVEMHHGRLWVRSKPGKGSSFYFTIPTY